MQSLRTLATFDCPRRGGGGYDEDLTARGRLGIFLDSARNRTWNNIIWK